MTVTYELPPEVTALLARFAAASKTGQLQLDIKDGKIVAWKLTESGRVDKRS